MMMKVRIATGLGLVLFIATMIGGQVTVSQAQDNQNNQGQGVTLASLAGKFAGRGGGFFTFCVSGGVQVSCKLDSPTLMPFNQTQISQQTRDAAGNGCEVFTRTYAPVSGTKSPANEATPVRVFANVDGSFDPTTGSGSVTFSQYRGGNCIGAVFDGNGILVGTGSANYIVSDSGNRIEFILTDFSQLGSNFTVADSVAGFVFSATYTRQ